MANHRLINDPEQLSILDAYRDVLVKKNYARNTIRGYIQNASRYLLTGLPITKESAMAYFEGLYSAADITPAKKKELGRRKAAVINFCDFFTGNIDGINGGYHILTESGNVCDEDCFNCKYPDCIY